MSTKQICDYCGKEMARKGKRVDFTVSLFDAHSDTEILEKDACASCTDILKRLLSKPIDRLAKALAAASDR